MGIMYVDHSVYPDLDNPPSNCVRLGTGQITSTGSVRPGISALCRKCSPSGCSALGATSSTVTLSLTRRHTTRFATSLAGRRSRRARSSRRRPSAWTGVRDGTTPVRRCFRRLKTPESVIPRQHLRLLASDFMLHEIWVVL